MSLTGDLRAYMDSTGGLPPGVLLGRITFYAIYDGIYDPALVAKWFEELDLNLDHVPRADSPVNAFKKATADLNEHSYPMPGGLNEARILIRPVRGSDEITRALVREIRDPANRKLSHDVIGHAVFYRASVRGGAAVAGSERIRVTLNDVPDADERVDAMAVKVAIEDGYVRLSSMMDGMKARQMVRDYLRYLNSLALKPGVYFVHATRADELARLGELVSRLGNGCSMSTLPLVDLREQRGMVVAAFQEETVKELEVVIRDIAQLRQERLDLKRKAVTGHAYARIKMDYDAIIRKAKEYTTMMNVSQDRTGAAADIALASLFELQRMMIEDAS